MHVAKCDLGLYFQSRAKECSYLKGKTMDKVTPFGKGWMRKADLAAHLSVHPRTINNMVNRGEALRTELHGTVWFKVLHTQHNADTHEHPPAPIIPRDHPIEGTAISFHGQDENPDVSAQSKELHRENQRLKETVASLKIELAQTTSTLECVKQERDFLRKASMTRLGLFDKILRWIFLRLKINLDNTKR